MALHCQGQNSLEGPQEASQLQAIVTSIEDAEEHRGLFVPRPLVGCTERLGTHGQVEHVTLGKGGFCHKPLNS